MLIAVLGAAARAAWKTDVAWHGATTLHPIGLASLLILGTWMFAAFRRTAMLPFMILICFIPSAQRIVILGADFTLLRLMVLFGIARILARSELTDLRLNRVDWVYLAWVLVGSFVYVIQQGELRALVYVCGTSMDMLGAYFIARALIRTMDEFRSFVRIAAWLAIPVSLFFLVELLTKRNLFSIFGGVPEITVVRDDRLRCQGAFSHPILAGVFWAALGAVFVGGALAARKKLLYISASACCVLIIGASASSTPVLGFAAAIAFWAAWPLRSLMRYLFIAAPFVLAGLHLVMKMPVWHLVSRVTAVGSSTGYHRYVLIDGAIRHFNEWWLTGTTWTGHWSYHFQTWDITNQYIFEGVRGGIWRLVLFLTLVLLAGLSITRAQSRSRAREDRFLLWGLGAMLFVHCVCFIGVSYFGQIQYLWYMTLAIASSAGTFSFGRPLCTPQRSAQTTRLASRPLLRGFADHEHVTDRFSAGRKLQHKGDDP